MPPGDFALKAKSQLPQGNLSLIAFGDVNLLWANSPGGMICLPYSQIYEKSKIEVQPPVGAAYYAARRKPAGFRKNELPQG
jgi:hypothetical protein